MCDHAHDIPSNIGGVIQQIMYGLAKKNLEMGNLFTYVHDLAMILDSLRWLTLACHMMVLPGWNKLHKNIWKRWFQDYQTKSFNEVTTYYLQTEWDIFNKYVFKYDFSSSEGLRG